MKGNQRRVEKEVGNCNGKYDRMVNHHFAPLISRPRGNRACFIQQFIRSPSILALNTLSPHRSAVHRVYRSTQQRPVPSADLQRSFQTSDRTVKHHYRHWTSITVVRPFTKSSIAAVSTNPPKIMHRKLKLIIKWRWHEKRQDSSTRQGTNGSPSWETLALCRNMLAIWKRQWSTVIKTEQRERRGVP